MELGLHSAALIERVILAAGGGGEREGGVHKVLGTMAVEVWRLDKRMRGGDGEVKEEFSRAYRSVEAMMDALAGIGVETQDWTGQGYSVGLPVKVVAFEDRDGLEREEIVETLIPGVRMGGEFLRQGEVIVGRPSHQKKDQ